MPDFQRLIKLNVKHALGAPKAITAMAHQLARIIWHLLTYRVPFDIDIFAAFWKRLTRHDVSATCNPTLAKWAMNSPHSRMRPTFEPNLRLIPAVTVTRNSTMFLVRAHHRGDGVSRVETRAALAPAGH